MIRFVLRAFYNCKTVSSHPSTPAQVKRQRTLKKMGTYLDLVDVMLYSWMKNKARGGSHLMCQRDSKRWFSAYVAGFELIGIIMHYPLSRVSIFIEWLELLCVGLRFVRDRDIILLTCHHGF